MKNVENVIVIGSGPAGLVAAYDLRKKGYQVTIFEALPFPGGMLRVGILEYRLPRDVLQSEIARVLSLGIELKLNSPVHKLDDLFYLTSESPSVTKSRNRQYAATP